MMIFLNPGLITYKQYDRAQKDNEEKMIDRMKNIIIDESKSDEEPKPKKGGSIVAKRTLPVFHTNPRNKGPKTFKL